MILGKKEIHKNTKILSTATFPSKKVFSVVVCRVFLILNSIQIIEWPNARMRNSSIQAKFRHKGSMDQHRVISR